MSMTLNLQRAALKEAARGFRQPKVPVGARVLCKKLDGKKMIGVVKTFDQQCITAVSDGQAYTCYHKDDPRLLFSPSVMNQWQWEFTEEYLREEDHFRRVQELEAQVNALRQQIGLPAIENEAVEPEPEPEPEPAPQGPQIGPHDFDFANEKYGELTDAQLREIIQASETANKQGLKNARRETLIRKLVEAGTP